MGLRPMSNYVIAKTVSSAIATAAWWAVAFLLMLLVMTVLDHRSVGLDRGLLNLAVATFVVSGVGWLTCGWPFVLLVSPASRVSRPSSSLVTGTLVGSIAAAIGTGVLLIDAGVGYLGYILALVWPFAIVVGVTAITVFPRILNRIVRTP
jgi:hypothetical protein